MAFRRATAKPGEMRTGKGSQESSTGSGKGSQVSPTGSSMDKKASAHSAAGLRKRLGIPWWYGDLDAAAVQTQSTWVLMLRTHLSRPTSVGVHWAVLRASTHQLARFTAQVLPLTCPLAPQSYELT